MLKTQTMDQLLALRLEGMAQALEEQRRQPDLSQWEFEDRLALLVERQWLWRENRALAARLHYAQLKLAASLEDIDYRHPRGLKRAQIDQLRASQWVSQHRNCLITGPTGSGKTYLACALAHQACRDGHRVCYYYAPKLFRVLVIDDFGVASVAGKQYRDLLEILDDRHGLGATLMTSQFPVNQWHELINDATVADAILDRLVHNAYRLELKGESLRKAKAALNLGEKTPAD
jgi:DNA replication protein DnaC